MTSANHPPAGSAPDSFESALSAAIEHRGVSLTWLRERLIATGNPVGLATLSSWRSGQRRPEGPKSLAALEELERLLGVRRGQLAGLLGPSRRLGRGPTVNAAVLADDVTALMLATMTELGCTPEVFGALTSSWMTLEVGPDREHRSITASFVVETSPGRTLRLPFIGVWPEVADPQRRSGADPFRQVDGGRRAQTVIDHARGVYGIAIELDPEPYGGGPSVVQVMLDVPPGLDVPLFDQVVPRRQHQTVMWVRFSPDAVPRAVERFHYTTDEKDGEVVRLTSPPNHLTNLVLHGFGPGIAGLRWEW